MADPAEVVVVGDSVTQLSQDPILDALAGRDVAVFGRPGFRTDHLVPVLAEAVGAERDADQRPEVAVVMAGYNDVWQGVEEDATVDELVDLMAEVDCAIWVLVPTKGPWERDRAQALERRIRDAAEAAGVAIETGWRDAVDADPGPDPVPDLVVPDGVHPSEAGRERVAAVVADAVARECG